MTTTPRKVGKALRAEVPRSCHAGWMPAPDRVDPVAILRAQGRTRIRELLPIRHGRMAESPLAFLRGAAAVMAADLAPLPRTMLRVQACGDAHLLNFGVWATPERHLVFEVNDFDETLPASFEWDVKRLAASVHVAARGNGCQEDVCGTAAQASVNAYRTTMAGLSRVDHLSQWYERIDVERVQATLRKQRKQVDHMLAKARRKTSLGALDKLTEVVDGERRIIEDPPLIQRISKPLLARTHDAYAEYVRSLPEDRRVLLQRYRLVDSARKVVGVGSVGTDTRMTLLLGDDDTDPLFLQIKEAQPSILEPHAGRSSYRHQGRRVVLGQRLMQAASDIFLGWASADGRDYYVRQLRDMKGSAEVERMSPQGLADYGRLCGAELARAHARSGDADAISAYLGRGEAFDRAVADFARAYADQNEADHAALLKAIKRGRVKAE